MSSTELDGVLEPLASEEPGVWKPQQFLEPYLAEGNNILPFLLLNKVETRNSLWYDCRLLYFFLFRNITGICFLTDILLSPEHFKN